MTTDELDDCRRILVAFEDAATWCEELAGIAQRALESQDPPSAAGASADLRQIADTLRFLREDRDAVAVVRRRIGLPPLEKQSSGLA